MRTEKVRRALSRTHIRGSVKIERCGTGVPQRGLGCRVVASRVEHEADREEW